MPLWKLQTIGRETRDFLYPNDARGSMITLRPGVGFCLRRFHDLLTNLIRGAWLDWVRRQNRDAIGDVADLDEFLFGTQRRRLRELAPALYDLQDGRCFYTGRRLDRPTTGEVDHFVPFARFPLDFGHNLVLASKDANACKSDRLAAEPHLERWCQRNDDAGEVIAREAASVGLAADLGRTIAVARWAYGQAASTRAPVWVKGREADGMLSGAWSKLLGAEQVA